MGEKGLSENIDFVLCKHSKSASGNKAEREMKRGRVRKRERE